MGALILASPVVAPYQQLKDELIRSFSKSKEAKLQQFLDGEQIGDRTPSQCIRHLKGLVPDIGEDVRIRTNVPSLPNANEASPGREVPTTAGSAGTIKNTVKTQQNAAMVA